MISVTYHHRGHGSTVIDGKDETRYTQLLAEQGITVTHVTRALICDDCQGLGVTVTPYCRRRKAHPFHAAGKCRKPCLACKGDGQFAIDGRE